MENIARTVREGEKYNMAPTQELQGGAVTVTKISNKAYFRDNYHVEDWEDDVWVEYEHENKELSVLPLEEFVRAVSDY